MCQHNNNISYKTHPLQANNICPTFHWNVLVYKIYIFLMEIEHDYIYYTQKSEKLFIV